MVRIAESINDCLYPCTFHLCLTSCIFYSSGSVDFLVLLAPRLFSQPSEWVKFPLGETFDGVSARILTSKRVVEFLPPPFFYLVPSRPHWLDVATGVFFFAIRITWPLFTSG